MDDTSKFINIFKNQNKSSTSLNLVVSCFKEDGGFLTEFFPELVLLFNNKSFLLDFADNLPGARLEPYDSIVFLKFC